jgi:hypothetical protein
VQSTNLKEIKAALWEQAFIGGTCVSCPIGQVVAIRRRKGHLLALIRGWGSRWYAVSSVTIERQWVRPASRFRHETSAQKGPIAPLMRSGQAEGIGAKGTKP